MTSFFLPKSENVKDWIWKPEDSPIPYNPLKDTE